MIIISTSFCWRRAAGDWLRDHPQNAGANGIPPSPPPYHHHHHTHTHALKNTLQMYFQNCNFATKGLKMAAGGGDIVWRALSCDGEQAPSNLCF